jgi:propionyl-CoA synthetase
MMGADYHEQYAEWAAGSDAYWQKQADELAWFKKPAVVSRIREDGLADYFPDGVLNTAFLALDHQVQSGRGEQVALIYDSPVTQTVQRWTYQELLAEVERLAGALSAMGVGFGDRVIIYLPMVPEAAFAMLACARLGAIHSVVFGGFAPRELATRIDDATPKVLLTATCGIEFEQAIPYLPLVDAACELAEHKVSARLVLARPEVPYRLKAGDLDWRETVSRAEPHAWVEVNATDPLYILYTSGTTGKPKGVVRDHGGHAVALMHSMKVLYGAEPGDVFWAASDVGWVVGHSYIVYAPLLMGCTTLLFEGKPVRTPDAGTFWRVMAEHKVNIFFTAPTAFRAIRKEDPEGALIKQYNLSALKALFLAGERTDPATYHWLADRVSVPVVDHWWQTETGSPVAGVPQGFKADLPIKVGSAGLTIPGYEVKIVDDALNPCAPNETGAVVLSLPLPPGCLPTVWNHHARLIEAYLTEYPGYYHTGDGGYIDEEGYLYITGRTDDVINVAGHRLSTGEMEAVVSEHQAVAECAVIGIADEDKGQVPLGLLVLKDRANQSMDEISTELIQMVRSTIGAFANFKKLVSVQRLPKTRSGKILRKTMRQIADHQFVDVPATIDDPAILDEIRTAMLGVGVGQGNAG